MSVADFAYAAVSLVDARSLVLGSTRFAQMVEKSNDPAMQSYRRDGLFLLILAPVLAAYGLGHYREIQTSKTIAKANALAEQSRTENLALHNKSRRSELGAQRSNCDWRLVDSTLHNTSQSSRAFDVFVGRNSTTSCVPRRTSVIWRGHYKGAC